MHGGMRQTILTVLALLAVGVAWADTNTVLRDKQKLVEIQAPGRWEKLVAETLQLANALGRHELEENRLIQDALMDDLGGGG